MGIHYRFRSPTCQKRVESEPLERRALFSAVAGLPRPDHVVVVVEEDHSYDQVLGSSVPAAGVQPGVLPVTLTDDSYIRQLAANGASLTQMHSVGHHNAQTYGALFAGLPINHKLNPPYGAPNLASELIAAGLSFGGYSESLPSPGYAGYDVGNYKRQHNPWVDFANVPAQDNLPFTAFPRDFSKLPTVSIVVPDLQNDMHSGFVSTADQWLERNIGDYADWATAHNSLLIVTWDESHQTGNQVPTILYGPMVERGNFGARVNQFNLLRTIEGMYGLPPTGEAAKAAPIDAFGVGGGDDATEDASEQFKSLHPASDDGPNRASITGRVFIDLPIGGGSRPREQGLGGWWVYLDTNNDGQFQPQEPSTVSDSRGRFTFGNLAAGSYTVRIVQEDGYRLVSPAAAAYAISLPASGHATHIDFSQRLIS